MSPAFQTLASHFQLLRLKVFMQLQQDTILPAFKGSMLHGWFGHALKGTDEHAFHVFYGEHAGQQPKPYMICPGADRKTTWHRGEIFDFDIVLFGDACQFAETVIQACQNGEALGFGAKRCPLKLISISSVLPASLRAGIHPYYLSEHFNQPLPTQLQTELALHFTSPVRLKHRGSILKHGAPRLDECIRHIYRRWLLLSRFWVVDDDQLFNALNEELPRLGDYEMADHSYYEDWQRYSHKQQDALPFGGLMGQVSFFGDIATAQPWLALGTHLHMGGKTTFGLGGFQLIG